MFEGLDKGKRGRLTQSRDAYMLGKDVLHFERSTKNSSEFITLHESAVHTFLELHDKCAVNSEEPFLKNRGWN